MNDLANTIKKAIAPQTKAIATTTTAIDTDVNQRKAIRAEDLSIICVESDREQALLGFSHLEDIMDLEFGMPDASALKSVRALIRALERADTLPDAIIVQDSSKPLQPSLTDGIAPQISNTLATTFTNISKNHPQYAWDSIPDGAMIALAIKSDERFSSIPVIVHDAFPGMRELFFDCGADAVVTSNDYGSQSILRDVIGHLLDAQIIAPENSQGPIDLTPGDWSTHNDVDLPELS